MRISERRATLVLLLALGGCGRDAPPPPPAEVPGATLIACALDGGSWARRCTVERGRAGDRVELVLRHPDGGFRRLLASADGRGIVTADGAVPATIRLTGARAIEIGVEGDRYRLPAVAGPRQ